MPTLLDAMKSAGGAQAERRGVNRWGTVTSVRATDVGYEVRCIYDYGADNQIATGWMPVLSTMVGPGWGLVSPPMQGAQAFVAPDLGNGSSGVVVGLAYSTKQMPPQAPQAIDGSPTAVVQGEFCIVGSAGQVLRFLPGGGAIYSKGSWVHEGTLTVKGDIVSTTGNITAQEGNIAATAGDVSDHHGSMDRLRSNYNIHVHGTSPTTSAPDPE